MCGMTSPTAPGRAEATSAAEWFDATGNRFIRHGDVGRFDEDGFLTLLDRKKDLIVNDKGDNVAPQRVEGMLTLQPEIAQAMVYGDRWPYLVALLVPDPEYAGEADVEQRLKAAVLRDALGGRSLHEAVNDLLGVAWDDELDVFRHAGDGADVRWLHQVV